MPMGGMKVGGWDGECDAPALVNAERETWNVFAFASESHNLRVSKTSDYVNFVASSPTISALVSSSFVDSQRCSSCQSLFFTYQ